MQYRRLGKTNLKVSEIGLGAEWLERMDLEGCRAIIKTCEEQGINILDCWMSEPNVRTMRQLPMRRRIMPAFRQRHRIMHTAESVCTAIIVSPVRRILILPW